MRELKDLAVRGRRVLIRQDLNVPRRDGVITSAARIQPALATIRMARAAGAKVLVMSHLGRPPEDCERVRRDPNYSLAPMAARLGRELGARVSFHRDYLRRPPQLQDGEVALLENVRFNRGEKNNADELARQYAALCDVFVMDAFGAAHRRQASTCGVIKYAQQSCAGPLLVQELRALSKVRAAPARPLLAIVGGAKASTKLTVLESLAKWVDILIPGGGIANTFLATRGGVGKSLHEPELVAIARRIITAARAGGARIILPEDVVVSKTIDKNALEQYGAPTIKAADAVAADEFILDVGPRAIACYERAIAGARTIIWNGPVGLFEWQEFSAGTAAVARAIAKADAYSVAGGGDTLAAMEEFIQVKKLSCVSTGGGAFLEYLEGKTLPAVAALAAAG